MRRHGFLAALAASAAAQAVPPAAWAQTLSPPVDAKQLLWYPRELLNIIETRDGQLVDAHEEGALRARLRALFDRYHTAPPVVLHLHGGNVDPFDARNSAQYFAPIYAATGAAPVFPIYHTGAAESLARSDAERRLLGVEHTSALSIVDRYRRNTELNAMRAGEPEPGLVKRENWMRYGLPPMSDLGYHGRLAWAYMKQLCFEEFDLQPHTTTPAGQWAHLVRAGYSSTRAGGVILLDALHEAYRCGARPRVVIIAHSTGAVYTTQLLRRMHATMTDVPSATVDVAFLAPAVSYTDFAQMLGEGAAARIGQFRIYAMDDKTESGDAVLATVLGPQFAPLLRYYSRSLLYLVSNVFEPQPGTPLLGLARFQEPDAARDAGNEPAMKAVRDFLELHPGAVRFSPNESTFPGEKLTVKHHGDFLKENDGDLDALLQYLVQKPTWK